MQIMHIPSRMAQGSEEPIVYGIGFHFFFERHGIGGSDWRWGAI